MQRRFSLFRFSRGKTVALPLMPLSYYVLEWVNSSFVPRKSSSSPTRCSQRASSRSFFGGVSQRGTWASKWGLGGLDRARMPLPKVLAVVIPDLKGSGSRGRVESASVLLPPVLSSG